MLWLMAKALKSMDVTLKEIARTLEEKKDRS
jgi:hypothetical protein